jgi:nitrite reductase/ring-hydroxylating ferredoxin subunit
LPNLKWRIKGQCPISRDQDSIVRGAAINSRYTKVATISEVPAGSMKPVEVGGLQVVLINVDGEYYALHDSCTHEYFPLSEGSLEDDCVVCMLHGARINLKTGAAGAPALEPVKTYEVKVEGDDILIATS